ncbi:hypothetical protein A3K80_09235 [Candidatus Bathyarchaeota archaeon RBG_13_38_9]|nr:MAG: hypothetical protein A3K80_09235 [Candidatus Bathyarchaeota archaeon RBG_13_38_9]
MIRQVPFNSQLQSDVLNGVYKMSIFISGQDKHIKGKINTTCTCDKCLKLRGRLSRRIRRRLDCKVNNVFRINKVIPFFRYTILIDIRIGSSKRKVTGDG